MSGRNLALATAILALGVLSGFFWRATRMPAQAPARLASPASFAREVRLAAPGDPARLLRLDPTGAGPAPGHDAARDGPCGLDGGPSTGEPAGVDENGTPTPEVPARSASPEFDAATRRLDASLRASPDPFARAVAVWLNVGDALDPSARMQALVREAAASNDPRVYGLAYRTCEGMPDRDDRCLLLSARRWAQLDDGNAVPWLYVLQQAGTRGDASTEQEALYRIAGAQRFDASLFAPAAAVVDNAPDDPAGVGAENALAMQAFGLSAAWGPSVFALTRACRDQGGGDANRAQLCAAVAQVLMNHADTLLTRSVGGVIDFQATGAASRRDRLRAETRALEERYSARLAADADVAPCRQVRRTLRQISRVAQVGEVAAATELARSAVQP